MNTLGISILSVLAVLVVFGSRRWALLSMMGGVLYLTQGQFIVAGDFTLYSMRILEVVAIVRVVLRREFPLGGLNPIDRTLILLYAFTVGVFSMRSNEGVAYMVGVGLDAILLYAVFRSLIRDVEDIRWLLGAIVVMLVPYASLVWIESITFQNSFASLGGVELIRSGDLWIREGRLRATGSFGHPSLMGTVGGVFLPLYVGLMCARPAKRLVGLLGVIACLLIVGASNSGGPMLCVATAIVGWIIWPIRKSMRVVRICMVLMLALTALIMKAPIWYLLARISNVTGGDGHHRAVLLDVAFQNLSHWWFSGMRAIETGRWLPYANTTTGAVDITNNFINFGISSGLGAVLLLIALLTVAYSQLGRSMFVIRTGTSTGLEPFYWGVGVTITVHVFNWFGITYWDQTSAVWFLHLAIAARITDNVLRGSIVNTVSPTAGTSVSQDLESQTQVRSNRVAL